MMQNDAEQLLLQSREILELLERGAEIIIIHTKMEQRRVVAERIKQFPDTSGMNSKIFDELKMLHQQESLLLIPYRAELQLIQEKLIKLKHAASYQEIPQD